MITDYKVGLCIKYNLNIDSWTRMASAEEISLMRDEEWHLILSYIHAVCRAKKGVLANSDLTEKEKLISANCENVQVFERLKTAAIEHCENQDKSFMRLLIDSLFKKKR